MARWIMLLFMLYGCTPQLLAQRPTAHLWWKKPPIQHLQGTSKLAEINITRQLEKRLDQTYRQAKQAQEQLPEGYRLIMGEPIQKVFKPYELDPVQLYPAQTFLKNAPQTGNYLATRNNRLFLQEVRRMKKVWEQINNHLPRLQQEAASTEQPTDQMQWLSHILPAQTTQFFIGEAHGYPEIYQSVAQLLKQVRTLQPEREIILFTEFLPENVTWSSSYKVNELPTIFHRYFPIWQQAIEANIPVIGLEISAAVNDDCKVRYLTAEGSRAKQTVWSTLEGVRLRNERWQHILSYFRTQYPDALFIIYAGADHVMYNRPFTLANNPQENPFVAILYPNRRKTFETTGRFSSELVAKPMRGPLERMVDQLDFHRDVIQWESPDLSAIAGFDARIKVPVMLEGIDN